MAQTIAAPAGSVAIVEVRGGGAQVYACHATGSQTFAARTRPVAYLPRAGAMRPTKTLPLHATTARSTRSIGEVATRSRSQCELPFGITVGDVIQIVAFRGQVREEKRTHRAPRPYELLRIVGDCRLGRPFRAEP
jgi:hypothetical protein